MNRLSIVRTLCVVFGAAVAGLPAVTLADYTTSLEIHGSACQGANLGQSLNRNTNWSRRGVFNDQPESGSSVYVVCPLTVTYSSNASFRPDTSSYAYVQWFVGERTTAAQIACTSHHVSTNNAASNKTVTNTANIACTVDGCGTPGQGSYLSLSGIFDYVAYPYYNSAVVICNLPPQTGIRGIGVYP